jgi:hypothetical protein
VKDYNQSSGRSFRSVNGSFFSRRNASAAAHRPIEELVDSTGEGGGGGDIQQVEYGICRMRSFCRIATWIWRG